MPTCPRASARPPNAMRARSSTGSPAPGPIGAGRAAISTRKRTPAPSSTSCATCSPPRRRRPISPQWFNTGLHWAYGIDGPSQGHHYVDYQHRQAHRLGQRLRASAAACLLHPGHRGRPRQRGRHHGPVGARGAPVQIRLGHRLQLLQAARRRRAAVGRRQVVGPDELPQDRRPRRRRHQVGRHHAPRRQDGGGRRRSPGHRELHQLEGARGAEGGGAGHRLQDPRRPPQGDHARLRELRRAGRLVLRPGQEPGAQARDQGGEEGAGPAELRAARHPVRQAGLHRHRRADLRHGLGFGGLSHRLRPELQQFGAGHRRFPARRRGRRRLAAHAPHHRQGRPRRSRPATCGRRSAMPPGSRPIPASSSTPPSTTGTPARPRGRSAPPTRARNTCSSTTRRAIWPRST